MGKILVNSQGKAILASGNAFEVTAAVDSNITAGNIKKDVTILGVTGTYEGGGDWLLEAKKTYTHESGATVDITAAQGAELAPLGARVGGFNHLFESTRLRDVDLTGVTTIIGGEYAFSVCLQLRSINLPDLQTINNSWGLFQTCRALTSISFPELTSVTGANALRDGFSGCWSLQSVSFPKLTNASTETAFWNAFSQCVALTTITVHPAALSNSGDYYNLLTSASGITTLIFSQEATDNVYMTWCTALSSASVLGILNKLSTSASGKTCAFGNITIPSSDENYAAISAKVSALTNWTITGLTL